MRCDDSDSPSGGPGPVAGGGPIEVTSSGSYRVIGQDSIVVYLSADSPSLTYCDGDSLVVIDSFLQDSAVSSYEFVGDSLFMYIPEPADTLDSSRAVVVYASVYVRSGSGSGLLGTWRGVGVEPRVLSGTPTAEELTELEQMKEWFAASWAVYETEPILTFTETTYSFVYSVCAGNAFVYDWNNRDPIDMMFDLPADSARYDIGVSADCNVVTLVGNVSGEVVTITYVKADGAEFMVETDEIYTSSDSGHARTTVYANPTTCPNDLPAWYDQFLGDNVQSSGAGKHREKDGSAHGLAMRSMPFGLIAGPR